MKQHSSSRTQGEGYLLGKRGWRYVEEWAVGDWRWRHRAPAAVVFICVFICSPEIGELPIGLRGTIIIFFFIIRVPLPALSRDVACRVSPR